MDGMTDKFPIREYFHKYRFILLILALGILFLVLPESTAEKPPEAELPQEQSLEESLAGILSQINGAGDVRVLLSQSAGERIYYQTDEDISAADTRRNTVLITGADRDETGLIRQILPPVYQGAIIVCQGADSAQIRLAIVEAVMCATGLTSDRISVLKMK